MESTGFARDLKRSCVSKTSEFRCYPPADGRTSVAVGGKRTSHSKQTTKHFQSRSPLSISKDIEIFLQEENTFSKKCNRLFGGMWLLVCHSGSAWVLLIYGDHPKQMTLMISTDHFCLFSPLLCFHWRRLWYSEMRSGVSSLARHCKWYVIGTGWEYKWGWLERYRGGTSAVKFLVVQQNLDINM